MSGNSHHGNDAGRVVGARRPRVRSGRTAAVGPGPAQPAVGVTFAAGGLGRRLAAELTTAGFAVRGLDVHRGDVPDVTWRAVDPANPRLVRALAGLDVVVHPALEISGEDDAARREVRVVRSTATVLTAAAAAGVGRVVVVSSALVYGAHPDNRVPLDEDAPLRAPTERSLAGDLLEVEAMVERAATVHPGLSVTVLRPATLVGPGVDTLRTRHFAAPRLLVVKGTDPHWQFCHLDDLASAVALVVRGAPGLDPGPLTVACDGFLTQTEVEEISGLRRIELPARAATATAERLHRLGITPAPPSDIAYSSWPWVVPSTRLRAAGWTPRWDNAGALRVLLDDVRGELVIGGRRLGGREAALGAAGTTVAVLSTAAVVRQLRRQRRG